MIKNDENLLLSSKPLNEEMADVPDDLTKLFTEFTALMSYKNDYEAGRKMLWQTSKIMTSNKLKGKVPVTDDFIVFSIEWSIDTDIEEILLQCGAAKSNIRSWEKESWLITKSVTGKAASFSPGSNEVRIGKNAKHIFSKVKNQRRSGYGARRQWR